MVGVIFISMDGDQANLNTKGHKMSKHTEIYGDKFGTLFIGIVPDGKTLDIVATERWMTVDLDEEKSEWIDANEGTDEETERAAFDAIGERLASDANWYDSNLVWIDA